jgi:osmoprotectant transport system permease protein
MTAFGRSGCVLLALLAGVAGVAGADSRPAAGEARTLQVGSKAFTESVVLGEIAVQSLRAAGLQAEHRREIGGSRILWDALLAGHIDAYAEYSGTLVGELLAAEAIRDEAQLRAALARRGLAASPRLGFENSYALGASQAMSERLGLRRIGDLRDHPRLRVGLSNEFLNRADGWPGLVERYGLPQTEVRGLDHRLAYQALEAGAIDLTDLYTTDPEIDRRGFVLLDDDLGFFPEYAALILYRADLPPAATRALDGLGGRIDTAAMRALNAAAAIERRPEAEVAATFLASRAGPGAAQPAGREPGLVSRVYARAREHLALTGLSMLFAVLVGAPLGILAARRPATGRVVIGAAEVVQTIPSLALLVFMIPLFGIGFVPAVIALFLYSLLPIIRGTASGLLDIAPELRDSAQALGLGELARLRLVELPLAARAIGSGIRTSAVINVGTATIAALIGAGGFGQPILSGIRLSDVGLILEGAIPAALLALALGSLRRTRRRQC